jgi:hypothetical protein
MWNKNNNTILHGLVKQCDFYLGRGNFIMFLVIGQPNGPLQKKRSHQNMHSQLINMDLQKGMFIKGI